MALSETQNLELKVLEDTLRDGGQLTPEQWERLRSLKTALEDPACRVPETIRYSRSNPEYGRIYGDPSRRGESIRRWRRDGTKAGQPPPLDDPRAMPAWWRSIYGTGAPDRILRAAAGLTIPPRTVPERVLEMGPENIVSFTATRTGADIPAPQVHDTTAGGYDETLESLRRMASHIRRQWEAATASGDNLAANLLAKELGAVSEKQRVAEIAAVEILERMKRIVPVEALIDWLDRCFAGFPSRLERALTDQGIPLETARAVTDDACRTLAPPPFIDS